MNRRNISMMLVVIAVLVLVFAGCSNNGPIQQKHYLAVSVEGEGQVYPSSGEYIKGTSLTFTINPASGWQFSDWKGQNYQDMVRTGDSWHLLMDSDKFLTAVFIKTSGDEGDRQLLVDVQGNGSVVPNSGFYKDGTLVVLNVQPQAGWSFSHWTGPNANEVYGSGNDWTIRMNGDKRVTAVFVTEQSSGYKLNVDIIGKGKVEEMLVSSEYPGNSRVRLWAKPENGWIFKEWRGDTSGTDEVAFINMTKDMYVTAVFVEKNYNLEIKIIGEGRVEERLMGEEYPGGSIVKLTAKAAAGWEFLEWRGDASGRNAEIFVEIEGDTEVTAVFEASEVYLDIEIIGKGKVEEELISDIYDPNSIVRLTAIPAKNWEFKEWRGDASGRKAVIEIEMDEDKEIIAVFEEKDEYEIKITITGEGRVDEKLIKEYPFGSIVQLTATPDSGWGFKEWRGDASGRSREIEIEMDEDKEIEAVFEERKEGTGEVSGQITISHMWPNPYPDYDHEFIAPRRNVGQLPLLSYASKRLNPQIKESFAPGELIVGFKPGLMLAAEEVSILSALNRTVITEMPAISAYLIEVPEVVDQITAMEQIDKLTGEISLLTNSLNYIEPNHYVYALGKSPDPIFPNDKWFSIQWHYMQIRAPQAWTVTKGSKSVRIAVADTGIAAHPDLEGNVDVASGWNFHSNNSDTADRSNHGTHVAGTIGARTDNEEGVAGLNWEVSMIPIKVLGDDGKGTMTSTANGILYAAGLGSKQISSPAQVINMSLGSSSPNATLGAACDRVAQAGVLLVAASGNDNGPIGYPAGYDSVICVGACDYGYPNAPKRSSYSCYGAGMDIVAPGGDMEADTDGNDRKDGVVSTGINVEENRMAYYLMDGTSMASPHAAGVVCMMLANGIPAGEVREILHRTAMDLGSPGFDNEHGHGLVNAYWAINNVKEIKLAVGTKTGDTIDAVAQGTVDLKTGNYTLGKIPEGEFRVYGWIDVCNTGTIDDGDYLFESAPIYFEDGGRQTVNINLEEVQ